MPRPDYYTVEVDGRTFIAAIEAGRVERIREQLVRDPSGKQLAVYTKPWWHRKHHRPDVKRANTIKARVVEAALAQHKVRMRLPK